MKKIFLAVWVLIPLAGVIYHLSAGERHRKMDVTGDHMQSAQSLLQKSEWTGAVGELEKALEELPDDADAVRRELRLELALAKMNDGGLPEAHEELKKLLDELNRSEADSTVDQSFEERVRESLASAQYYMTWLMRLEGLPREEWEPEIESSRQNYRLLAERAQLAGDRHEEVSQLENLEASIRLARLELTDLQGLPIPKPCKCCCSGQCRARREGPPKTGQTKDARGASAGPPADGKGS
jgi:tetratricopeptide (TPR) repeat protein